MDKIKITISANMRGDSPKAEDRTAAESLVAKLREALDGIVIWDNFEETMRSVSRRGKMVTVEVEFETTIPDPDDFDISVSSDTVWEDDDEDDDVENDDDD